MKFQTLTILGNATHLAQVGQKQVLTVAVKNQALSKDKAVFDNWQVNLFVKDAQRMSQESSVFRDMMTALKNNSSFSNLEFVLEASMTQKYINAKGKIVYPYPQFKVIEVVKHLT